MPCCFSTADVESVLRIDLGVLRAAGGGATAAAAVGPTTISSSAAQARRAGVQLKVPAPPDGPVAAPHGS